MATPVLDAWEAARLAVTNLQSYVDGTLLEEELDTAFISVAVTNVSDACRAALTALNGGSLGGFESTKYRVPTRLASLGL